MGEVYLLVSDVTISQLVLRIVLGDIEFFGVNAFGVFMRPLHVFLFQYGTKINKITYNIDLKIPFKTD